MGSAERLRSVLVAASLLIGVAGFAADRGTEANKSEKVPPTGPEILKMVRMTQALQDLKNLKGRLRIEDSDLGKEYEGRVYPFDLTMSENVLRFVFNDPPKETINLDLKASSTKLTRVSGAGRTEVPVSLYGERVRQTAINFEDLAMRFLYWPNSKLAGEEWITARKCWKVRVPNPDSRGPYRWVDLWVDQKSRAMVRMRAYDEHGQVLKEFSVRQVQGYKDGYILKLMRVDTHDPTSEKVVGRTYLEIEDPG